MTINNPVWASYPEEIQKFLRLESIFRPSARRARDRIYGTNESAQFVHYTSAEAALKIISTKRLWLRNTTCMSDYREVQHGYDMLNASFSRPGVQDAYVAALNNCRPNLADETLRLFASWWGDIRTSTYIASVSEHDSREDFHGRLSMWRAFGGNSARVAIVLNVPKHAPQTESLRVMLNPVLYFDQAQLDHELDEAIARIVFDVDFLRAMDQQTLLGYAFNMLVANVTSLKHEGFSEEQEWRVLYAPKRLHSPLMEPSTQIINGVPQLVYQLPLDGQVAPELGALDLANMFERLIIGPSAYPWAMYEAFVSALSSIGVPDAGNRVCASGIPIRS